MGSCNPHRGAWVPSPSGPWLGSSQACADPCGFPEPASAKDLDLAGTWSLRLAPPDLLLNPLIPPQLFPRRSLHAIIPTGPATPTPSRHHQGSTLGPRLRPELPTKANDLATNTSPLSSPKFNSFLKTIAVQISTTNLANWGCGGVVVATVVVWRGELGKGKPETGAPKARKAERSADPAQTH